MKEKVTVYELFVLHAPNAETVLVGTITDVRTWAKNEWKEWEDFIKGILGELVEEEFYAKMDDDLNLFSFLESAGYGLKPLCEIPLDDFYDEEKPKQELIDEVMERIKKDIAEGDLTALDEMLQAMPIQQLVNYLPEN